MTIAASVFEIADWSATLAGADSAAAGWEADSDAAALVSFEAGALPPLPQPLTKRTQAKPNANIHFIFMSESSCMTYRDFVRPGIAGSAKPRR